MIVIAPDSVSPYPYPKLCFTFGKTIFDLLISSSGIGAPPHSTFRLVFSKSLIAVSASMASYLLAQFVDIKIYHFWKNLTKGKMLWLRNNFSTFFSQILDTFTIIFLLCYFQVIPWESFTGLFVSGVIFKILVAAVDTPLLYLGVYFFRKNFNLKINEEIKI